MSLDQGSSFTYGPLVGMDEGTKTIRPSPPQVGHEEESVPKGRTAR